MVPCTMNPAMQTDRQDRWRQSNQFHLPRNDRCIQAQVFTKWKPKQSMFYPASACILCKKKKKTHKIQSYTQSETRTFDKMFNNRSSQVGASSKRQTITSNFYSRCKVKLNWLYQYRHSLAQGFHPVPQHAISWCESVCRHNIPRSIQHFATKLGNW